MAILIPRAQRDQGEIKSLQTRLTSATDPNQQRRLQTRMNYLQKRNAPAPQQVNSADQNELKSLETRFSTATDPIQKQKLQTRINFLQRRNGIKPTVQTSTQPAGQNLVTPQPEPQPMAQNAAPAYRGVREFMPADVTQTQSYKNRIAQAQQSLDRQLSANGLTGSGRAIEQELDITGKIAADENDRQYENAKFEAQRFDQSNNEGFDRAYKVLSLLADQNPMQYAYQGTGQYNEAQQGLGNAQANYAANNYQRVSPGAGAQTPIYAPPMASGPDFSQADLLGVRNSQSNTNSLLGGLSSILGLFR